MIHLNELFIGDCDKEKYHNAVAQIRDLQRECGVIVGDSGYRYMKCQFEKISCYIVIIIQVRNILLICIIGLSTYPHIYETYKLDDDKIDAFWNFCITKLDHINNAKVYLNTITKYMKKGKNCRYYIKDISELLPISNVKSARSN